MDSETERMLALAEQIATVGVCATCGGAGRPVPGACAHVRRCSRHECTWNRRAGVVRWGGLWNTDADFLRAYENCDDCSEGLALRAASVRREEHDAWIRWRGLRCQVDGCAVQPVAGACDHVRCCLVHRVTWRTRAGGGALLDEVSDPASLRCDDCWPCGVCQTVTVHDLSILLRPGESADGTCTVCGGMRGVR
jgi:hypothetical protein